MDKYTITLSINGSELKRDYISHDEGFDLDFAQILHDMKETISEAQGTKFD